MQSDICQEIKQEDRDILMIFLMKDFIKNHSLENMSDQIFSSLVKNNFIKSQQFSSDKLDTIKQTILENLPSQDIFKQSRFLTDFTIIDKIGIGGFGSVFKVINKLDKKEYAIKLVNIDNKDLVLREVENLSKLNHPNIIRYYGSWIENIELTETNKYLDYSDDSFSESFSSSGSYPVNDISNYLFLQMELASTNLKEIQNTVSYKEKRDIFKDIVLGLNEIHSNNIIHRDLKPSNILIIDGKVKIGDFGLSRSLDQNRPNSLTNGIKGIDLTGELGSRLYSSPEQLVGDEYDYRTDIYSLGIILFEMLANFNTEMEKNIEIMKLKNEEPISMEINLETSPKSDELKFIRLLMDNDYQKRPSTKKILEILSV